MKTFFACLLLVAISANLVQSKPWGGKQFTLNIQKNYDGPNLADILSSVVRTKMALKKSLWDSLLAAKSKSYSYNYSYNYDPAPVVHKTHVTVQKEYIPVQPVKTSDIVIHKRIEVITNAPLATKATTTTTTEKPAAAVEHVKTFTFNSQTAWGAAASSSASAGSGSGSGSSNDNQTDDSELVDISELQRNHDEK